MINLLHAVNVPTELKSLLSPLSAAAVAKYSQLYKQKGSVGNLCKDGHLFCDAEEFAVYHDQHLDLAKSPYKLGTVFFREAELVKGAHLTLVDQYLQSAAKERNMEILSTLRIFAYGYIYAAILVPDRAFLPHGLADVIPFGIESIDQALSLFGIAKNTALAGAIAKTLEICQLKKELLLDGEQAACATSFESLMGILESKFTNGHAWESLGSDPRTSTITARVLDLELKVSETSRHAICHNLMYPYSVFFCHYVPNTRIYAVTLQAPDGSLVKNAAVCHLDTSEWNPKHLAFLDLNTVPGQSEACHWLLKTEVAFVPI